MNEPNSSPPDIDFKDRRTGLIVFGILTIILGCICALLLPLMIFGQTVSARATGAPPNYQAILPAFFIYGAMSVALIWLGIGSIQARRWARALLLIFSVSWLVTGAVALVFLAGMLPQFLTGIASTDQPGRQELPAAAKTMIILITLLVFGVVFVILPGVWVLFYRSKHVKATCEVRDPMVRWTDACPLPVLALSIWLGLGVPMMLAMPLTSHGVIPFFGIFISGFPGTMMYLILAAVWGYSARVIYKLDQRGWWLIVVTFSVFIASHVITFSRNDIIEFYRLMGYPEQQIELMQKFSFLTKGVVVWGMLVFTLPFLGFLLYVKKYIPRHRPSFADHREG